jgi:hypothetical protein
MLELEGDTDLNAVRIEVGGEVILFKLRHSGLLWGRARRMIAG